MEDQSKHFVGNVAQKAVIEKDGTVLVCRGVGDTVWEFPGGRLHADESPEEGLKREIKEELGLVIKVDSPICVTRSFHQQAKAWQVLIGYRCDIVDSSAEKLDTTELDEIRWISKEELKALPMFDDCREVADVYLTV